MIRGRCFKRAAHDSYAAHAPSTCRGHRSRWSALFSGGMTPLDTSARRTFSSSWQYPPRPPLECTELSSQPVVVAHCLLKPHTVAEGPHVEEHTDEITDVLRECEETLRALARQGRLTDAALAAFTRLAHSVEEEMERRRGRERRRDVRSSWLGRPDRRSGCGRRRANTSCLNA